MILAQAALLGLALTVLTKDVDIKGANRSVMGVASPAAWGSLEWHVIYAPLACTIDQFGFTPRYI